MNIADAIQCLSDMVLFATVFGKIDDSEFKVLAMTVSSLIARSSIAVTGVITIYLNLLRTSAIIWPMLQFNKKRLHLSLLVILVIFFIFEIAMGIFYSYPLSEYLNMPQGSTDVTMPFLVDHPLRLVFSNSFICFSIPIIFAVIVCCITSTAKLIQPDKNLSQIHDQGPKRRAATTVLILSIQYVVLNTCGVILFSLEDHFERVREKDQSEVKIPRFMLTNFAIALLHLNAILNPIVYICRVSKLREPLKMIIENVLPCWAKRNVEEEPNIGLTYSRDKSVNEVVHPPASSSGEARSFAFDKHMITE